MGQPWLSMIRSFKNVPQSSRCSRQVIQQSRIKHSDTGQGDNGIQPCNLKPHCLKPPLLVTLYLVRSTQSSLAFAMAGTWQAHGTKQVRKKALFFEHFNFLFQFCPWMISENISKIFHWEEGWTKTFSFPCPSYLHRLAWTCDLPPSWLNSPKGTVLT